MAHAVFDLHCDTADRLAWQALPESLKLSCGMPFYGPGDELQPSACRELGSNRCQVSLDRIGATPWAQCFACFIPDEAPAPSPSRSIGTSRSISTGRSRKIRSASRSRARAPRPGSCSAAARSRPCAPLRTPGSSRSTLPMSMRPRDPASSWRLSAGTRQGPLPAGTTPARG